MPPALRLNGREARGAAAARSLLAVAVAAAVVLGTAAAERTRPIGACRSGGAARCCTWVRLGSLPKEGWCAATCTEPNFSSEAFVNVENGTLDAGALPKLRRVRSRSLGLQSDGVVIGGEVVALALALASTSPQLDSTAGRSPQTARRSHEAADRKHSEVRLPTDARDEPDGLLRDDIMLRMWHNAWTIGNTDTRNVCDGLDKELEDIDSHGNAFLTAANVTVTTATKFVNADSSTSSLGAEALTTNIDIRDVVLKTSSSKGDSISCQGVPVLQAEDDTDLAPPSGSFATSDYVCLLPTTKPKALLADDISCAYGHSSATLPGAEALTTTIDFRNVVDLSFCCQDSRDWNQGSMLLLRCGCDEDILRPADLHNPSVSRDMTDEANMSNEVILFLLCPSVSLLCPKCPSLLCNTFQGTPPACRLPLRDDTILI